MNGVTLNCTVSIRDVVWERGIAYSNKELTRCCQGQDQRKELTDKAKCHNIEEATETPWVARQVYHRAIKVVTKICRTVYQRHVYT